MPSRRRAGKRVQCSLYDDVQTIHTIRRAEATIEVSQESGMHHRSRVAAVTIKTNMDTFICHCYMSQELEERAM